MDISSAPMQALVLAVIVLGGVLLLIVLTDKKALKEANGNQETQPQAWTMEFKWDYWWARGPNGASLSFQEESECRVFIERENKR